MALPLQLGKPSRKRAKVAEPSGSGAAPGDETKTGKSAFVHFAETCAKIAGTTKKLEKTALLAEYLKTLEAKALPIATVWFTGTPFPSSQNKALQLGWAIIRDALCATLDVDQSVFGQVYLKHSDLGEAAFEMLERRGGKQTSGYAIEDVDALFEKLLAARGPIAKLPLLTAALQRTSPLEAKFLVKILTGDLRIGLKEGLVEEAVAKAFESPLDQIKQVNLLVGNVGETALLALHKQLPAVTLLPFRAVKYMLASPEETAVDIWNRVQEWHGPAMANDALPNLDLPKQSVAVWVEDKYDGIRAQIHKVGKTVAIFSRDLKEITRSFDELAEAAARLESDFISDGEIVAMRGDTILPYAELQKRLGRREADLFMREQIPVQFIAFDLLWKNGENLLDKPLSERRKMLEAVVPGAFRAAQITEARSEDEIEQAFTAARARSNEGLIVKDPTSSYVPGRRGLAWLKLKKAYATLDCVVVGAVRTWKTAGGFERLYLRGAR